MRDIGILFIVLEGMKVVVYVTGTVLPLLQLNSYWKEGLVGRDDLFKSLSL